MSQHAPFPLPTAESERSPHQRKRENAALESPSLLLFALLATLGVLAYGLFLLNPANRGDWLPYALVLTAEVVLIVQALFAMWTILSGSSDPRDYRFHDAQQSLFGAVSRAGLRKGDMPIRLQQREVVVDVFVTVCGEAVEVVEATVRAALNIRGRHRTWVLDDGRSPQIRALAERLGARYVTRLSSGGAKAGNVNHALTLAKGDYFAIFDADFVPDPDFLYETLPFFSDERVAFVQTPQAYGNMRTAISKGAGYMQTVFYRLVQPGRNRFNAAFCVGTNVVFRRSAIDDIGGMYTDSKSEDVWTSLMLHERGWRSVYIPVTLAVGDAPETVEAYTKQQLRWASGGFEILLSHNPLSLRRRLTLDQRLQYFVTATHYLVGISPILLLLVPPMEIFLDLRPVNLSVAGETWALYYLGFYGLQVLLAFNAMGSFKPQTLMLATVSFPIYVRAFLNVLGGKEQKWHVTGSRSKGSSPFDFMVPQMLLFTFLALTSLVAVYKDLGNQALTIATAWNLTNTLVLGAFMCVGLLEVRRTRAASAAAAVALAPSLSFRRPVSHRALTGSRRAA